MNSESLQHSCAAGRGVPLPVGLGNQSEIIVLAKKLGIARQDVTD
jgi:hypothetical protein